MNLSEMKAVVEERVLDLFVKFEENFGNNTKYPIQMPDEILYDKKGQTAGICKYNFRNHNGTLNFNPILMEENWDDFDQTIVHEVAHLCTYFAYGIVRRGRTNKMIHHGNEWKRMMAFFGKDADRCHSYNTSNSTVRRQRRWSYKCSCQTHEISTVIHNRMRNQSRTYSCRSCRTPIEYIG